MSTQSYKEFELKGRSFYIRKMGATPATKMLLRLAKLFGPAMVSMMNGKKEDKSASIPAAFMSLIHGLDEEVGYALVKDLVSNVTVVEMGSKTAADVYNSYFEGRIIEPFQLAWEVVNYNYENFFDEVASLIPGLKEVTKKKA